MTRIATITLRDEVNANIRGLSPIHRDDLFDKWTIKAHNCHFMPSVRTGKWDGKLHFVKVTGNTYINLLPEIVEWLDDRDYDIDVIDRREDSILTPELVDKNLFVHTEFGYQLRWYQVEAINACLTHGSGVVLAATASGKSAINAGIVSAYESLRSITIVPNTDLVIQTCNTFRKCGLDAGMYYSKKKEIEAQHLISTWQSLQNNKELLKEFSVIVVDELHGAKSSVLNDMLTTGYGAAIQYRFGLTGTMPKPKPDIRTLKCSIGEPIYTITAKQLQDEGFLSKLKINILQMQDSPTELLKRPKFKKGDTEAAEAAYGREKRFLTVNKPRIKNIADIITAKHSRNESNNTLVLVDSIDVGNAMAKILNVTFMYGKTKTEDRTLEYNSFESSESKLLIATFKIASTGIDITKVHNIIMIDSGKSFTKTIQSIGRGLRKNAEKNFVDIYDICSNPYYSNRHMNERIKYYEEAHYEYDVTSELV